MAALVSTRARSGVAAAGEHGRRGGRRSRGAQAKPAWGAGMVDGRGQLPRRPHDYQAAAPRPAIPGNGVNLSLLITPTRIPLGIKIPPIRIFPVESTQYRESAPDMTSDPSGG